MKLRFIRGDWGWEEGVETERKCFCEGCCGATPRTDVILAYIKEKIDNSKEHIT